LQVEVTDLRMWFECRVRWKIFPELFDQPVAAPSHRRIGP
jgi:hypothetical protein